MANEILNSLLKEYEQKKLKAELDLEKRKENLYLLIPRLKDIDDEINSYAIQTAKNLLNNSSDEGILDNLNEKINNLKKLKMHVLEENNYNLDYLKPQYECNICNDSGYILDDNFKTNMCNCLKQKLLNTAFNKSNMYNLNKQNFNNFNENIFSNDVDLSKYKFNISPRTNIINIKNKCIEFIDNFDNADYKNLLFTGSTGLRKNLYV